MEIPVIALCKQRFVNESVWIKSQVLANHWSHSTLWTLNKDYETVYGPGVDLRSLD